MVNHCWLIQLFSLACTIKGYNINNMQNSEYFTVWGCRLRRFALVFWIETHRNDEVRRIRVAAEQICDLPRNEAGIIWDSICFAFLLLQRRVFMSYYFLHVVADIRASQILASR